MVSAGSACSSGKTKPSKAISAMGHHHLATVDPNAVVGADYQLNLITKRDGTVISGMLDKETATALVVGSGL